MGTSVKSSRIPSGNARKKYADRDCLPVMDPQAYRARAGRTGASYLANRSSTGGRGGTPVGLAT